MLKRLTTGSILVGLLALSGVASAQARELPVTRARVTCAPATVLLRHATAIRARGVATGGGGGVSRARPGRGRCAWR